MQFITDTEQLEQMIERCFALDCEIKVFDSKGNIAELKRRIYKLNGEVETLNLAQCKHIFIGLIKKHRLFDFNNQNYYYKISKRELRNL